MSVMAEPSIESTVEGQLESVGIAGPKLVANVDPSILYEQAIRRETAAILSSGALATLSGEKTGRSPKDKRVADEESVKDDVWWGKVNIPLSSDSFDAVRQLAIEGLSSRDQLYVVDGFVGWDPRYRLKVRIVTTLAYHALFMHNMLIRPTAEELEETTPPDFIVYNAGEFSADPSIPGVTSKTCVALSFERGEIVILGTQYAGEMKKGLFTVMNYLMPKRGVFSMHCSANKGKDESVSLFFGLSGTGKTTLSADPHRSLIGDDEHCWSNEGVFNIEGGCYAKCINLSAEKEPEIFSAIRYGSVLENVTYDPIRREPDYADGSITENTRAAYPIEYIPNAKIPCMGGHPSNILFLTCDAFGVLPPVSRLSPEQAMYHFISGYTAKVAGTEVGVTEPQATFSACFGQPFIVWHPAKYAEMLREKMLGHKADVWLINTGWVGGGYGVGSRISLKYTRAMIDAIHSGELAKVDYAADPVFGLQVPTSCPGVPSEVLSPRRAWKSPADYDTAAQKLSKLFRDNFEQYRVQAGEEIAKAGPV